MTIPIRPSWQRVIDTAPPERRAHAYMRAYCFGLASMLTDDPRTVMGVAGALERLCYGAVDGTGVFHVQR